MMQCCPALIRQLERHVLHGILVYAWLRKRASPPLACCAADGEDVQDALMDVTGRRTVPQVFIGSKFVGGCDGESQVNCVNTCL